MSKDKGSRNYKKSAKTDKSKTVSAYQSENKSKSTSLEMGNLKTDTNPKK